MEKDDLNSVINYCQKLSKKSKAIQREVTTVLPGGPSCSQAKNFNYVECTIDRWPSPGKPWFEGVDSSKFLAIDVEGVFPKGTKLATPAHICAVNLDEEVVFDKKIYYKAETFNPRKKITGFIKYY